MGEGKRKKQKLQPHSEPTGEEMKMAKHTRFCTPKKSTVCQKQNVDYFVGSKAIDTLMSSKWTKPLKKQNFPLIQNRSDAINFMQKLLMSDKFYRANKVLKESKPAKDAKAESNAKGDSDAGKLKKRKKGKEEKGKEEKETEKKKETSTKPADEKEKKKRKKYRLVFHDEQTFVDAPDALYVWKYDPITPKKMFLGVIVVLGIIGVTLFPLWPPSVRVGVYYLSVCGGAFVGSILVIAAGRSIIFVLVWALSFGKHRFWFLPNLLADVSFFDSFKPVYTYEIFGDKKKDKNSDSEGEEENKSSPPDPAVESNTVDEIDKNDVETSQNGESNDVKIDDVGNKTDSDATQDGAKDSCNEEEVEDDAKKHVEVFDVPDPAKSSPQ